MEFPRDLFSKRIAQRCGVSRKYAYTIINAHKAGTLIIRTKRQEKVVAAYQHLKKQYAKP